MWTASHPHDLETIQKADLPSKRMFRRCVAQVPAYTPEAAHGSYSERLRSSAHKRIHIAHVHPASCRRYNGPPSVHPDAHRCSRLCLTRESSSPIKCCYQNADGDLTFLRSTKPANSIESANIYLSSRYFLIVLLENEWESD